MSALTLLGAGLTTGLLAGGASCALMHGGLIAAAVGRQRACGISTDGGRRAAFGPSAAFVGGKFASHVVAGALLGLLGAAAEPGPRVRGVLLVAAAVLMILAALPMLGLRRFGSRMRVRPGPVASGVGVGVGVGVGSLWRPAGLGFLTVLVPCGVTLSVGLLAMQSASPIAGAAAMGGFVIGTAPLLAALGYLVSRSTLRGRLPVVAGALVFVVAVWTLGAGLRLGGLLPETDALAVPASAAAAVAHLPDGTQTVTLKVTNNSFTPSAVELHPGVPTRLILTTRQTRGCTRMFVLGQLDIQRSLPETGVTPIDLGALTPGVLRYTCGIGLHSGRLVVREPLHRMGSSDRGSLDPTKDPLPT